MIFAACYGYRDEICLVEAETKQQALDIVKDKLIQILLNRNPELSELQIHHRLYELAVVISDQYIESVTGVDA